MLFLSYAYRFLSNFVFLALVYLALNFLEKYQHRVVVAVLVLVYAGMHAASALRSFHFFQRIERLEAEARRLFERSLTFDAHDSTAYTNLGVLALDAGQRDEAASRFAEALWLNAADATARQGLSRALSR